MQIINLLTTPEEENNLNIILDRIKNFFFSSDNYENFNFNSKMSSLRILITALLIGVFVFSVIFAIKKSSRKKFIDAIIKAKAFSAENARTLAELELAESKSILRALKNGDLSRLVSDVQRDEYNLKNFGEKKEKTKISPPPYKVDTLNDRFYLDEKKAESLSSIYGGKLGGVQTVMLTAVFCIALWFALDAAIPFFLSLIDARL